MTIVCPPELRRLYRERRVIPFIGAGASMAVTWERDGEERRGPSWRELVDKAAILLGADDPELLRMRGTDLQILEYLRIKKDGYQPLVNWLHASMQPKDEDLLGSPIHNALSELECCRLFYTTNYDDFLERVFKLKSIRVTTISSEHDLSEISDSKQVLLTHFPQPNFADDYCSAQT